MAMLVLDSYVEDQLKAERQERGIDGQDEIWDDVYIVAPTTDNQHQEIRMGIAVAIRTAVGWDAAEKIYMGANVSDREEHWLRNVRVPDIVVVSPASRARDCGSHLMGGPDFLAEIVTPHDRSREKIDFYSQIGVRELMVIDRDPWQVEFYRLQDDRLELVGRSRVSLSSRLVSEVLPMSFRLIAGSERPKIEAMHHDGVQRWIA